jgi:hypothetical protein
MNNEEPINGRGEEIIAEMEGRILEKEESVDKRFYTIYRLALKRMRDCDCPSCLEKVKVGDDVIIDKLLSVLESIPKDNEISPIRTSVKILLSFAIQTAVEDVNLLIDVSDQISDYMSNRELTRIVKMLGANVRNNGLTNQ